MHRTSRTVRPRHARRAAAAAVPRHGRPARAWEKFRGGSLLDRGPLSLREREIVIDRTCALNRCEYEWGVHVATFAEAAHLTGEAGPRHRAWRRRCAVLVGGREGDAGRGRCAASPCDLSEAEFAALKAHYDEAKILEIIQLCGFYRTVSYLCNGLALPLEPNGGAVSADA